MGVYLIRKIDSFILSNNLSGSLKLFNVFGRQVVYKLKSMLSSSKEKNARLILLNGHL